MSRTSYEIYQEQTFVLAKTLIVKHEEIALSTNHELSFTGHHTVLDTEAYNWRYYKNLAGEYHQYDKDVLMEKYGTEYMMAAVPSNAGIVEVPFVKELIHGTNADVNLVNEYSIGSRLYLEMVERYPEFEHLIIGILNPIDIDVAIKAKNGEILYIDGLYKKIDGDHHYFVNSDYRNSNTLIEPQEYNLIPKLQTFIYNYLDNWVNREYIDGNDLYTVAVLGILYTQIPNVLMNIRLGNCKTVYAHSFHIKQYLDSHGQLGKYVDFIPLKSALWLYRNLVYLESNRGKQNTFHQIIDNLWTPNNLPMNAYSIKHKLNEMGEDKLTPNGILYKEPINFEIQGISDDDRSVRNILDDQIPLAKSNHLHLDEKEKKIQSIIDWGGDDRLNTKVLETEMLELGDPYPFTLEQMLLNLWGYTAYKGLYTGTIYVTHPLSGDRIGFTPKNAYLLAMYCLNYAVADVELKTPLVIRFRDIPRVNSPACFPTWLTQSDRKLDYKPTVEVAMNWVNNKKTRKLKVQEIIGAHEPQFANSNSKQFFESGKAIFDERIRKYYAYCNTEELEERGDLHLVADRCYWHDFEETVLDMEYSDWFKTIGVDLSGMEREDILKLGLELVASATGVEQFAVIRKKWLQKAMIAILKHFISYTAHIIEKFSDGIVAYLDGQVLRYSNFEFYPSEPMNYKMPLYLNILSKVKHTLPFVFNLNNMFGNSRNKFSGKVVFPYLVDGTEFNNVWDTRHVGNYNVNIDWFNFASKVKRIKPIPEGPTEPYPVPPITGYVKDKLVAHGTERVVGSIGNVKGFLRHMSGNNTLDFIHVDQPKDFNIEYIVYRDSRIDVPYTARDIPVNGNDSRLDFINVGQPKELTVEYIVYRDTEKEIGTDVINVGQPKDFEVSYIRYTDTGVEIEG